MEPNFQGNSIETPISTLNNQELTTLNRHPSDSGSVSSEIRSQDLLLAPIKKLSLKNKKDKNFSTILPLTTGGSLQQRKNQMKQRQSSFNWGNSQQLNSVVAIPEENEDNKEFGENIKSERSSNKIQPLIDDENELKSDIFKRRMSVKTNINIEQLEEKKFRQKLKEYWLKFKFYPSSPFKIKWDLFIITLSLYNSILVPYNFAFPDVLSENDFFLAFEYIIDICFAFDILVNFRSVYYDSKNEIYITNGKLIALNYLLKGRFVIDLLASLPIEEIFQLLSSSVQFSKSNLKLISLFKLVRLLRLGRIITFLKMNQNFKQAMKIIQLFAMLIMVLHWIACFWYYIISLNDTWVPMMDRMKDVKILFTDSNYGQQYLEVFYYAILALVGNEMNPSNSLEIGVVSIIIFIGSIIIGTIIGEFSTILSEFQLKAKQLNEELDMICQLMTSLKIPETSQNRVLAYYELKNSMKYVRNEQFYDLLNENLIKIVKLFQTEDAIRNLGLFDKNNQNQIENFANLMKIQLYLPSDVVAKQGDIGDYFYLVVDGLAEVRSEKRDFLYFDYVHTQKFLGDYVPSKGLNDGSLKKLKKFIQKCMQKKQVQRFKTKMTSKYIKICRRKLIKSFSSGNSNQAENNSLDMTQQDLLSNHKTINSEKLGVKQIDETQFKIINELKQGDYFGEISIITNLKKTCSVYSVNNLICGLIPKKDLLDLILANADFKSRLMQRMNLYKDNFFKFITTMIRNVGAFRIIPNHVVKSIIFKLSERKYLKHSYILRMGEVADYAFFVMKGRVGVYVFIGDIYDYQNCDEFNKSNYQRLCTLSEGSHFNVTHFILQKESIFLFRAEEETDLLQLDYQDYHKLSLRSEILQNINDSIGAVYGDEGNKYDFGRMIYKSITDIIKSQKIKENYMKTKQRIIEELKDQKENYHHVNIYDYQLLKQINKESQMLEVDIMNEDTRSQLKQNIIEKFKRNLFLLRCKGFHSSQMEIFNCIDQINYKRVRKECERKMDKAVQVLSENFFELQVMQNISEYTMLCSYYKKYPQIKEVNQYYIQLKKDERLKQKELLKDLNGKNEDYPFTLKGDLLQVDKKDDDYIKRDRRKIKQLKKIQDQKSQSLDIEKANLNMGINGPIIGVGQYNENLVHSIDNLQEIIDKEKDEIKKQIKECTLHKEIKFKISVTNDEENQEFQQQFKVLEQTYLWHNMDEKTKKLEAKLIKEEKSSLALINSLTEQAESNQDLIDMIKKEIVETDKFYQQKIQEIEFQVASDL
ncbi:voltage-gated ion channel superfamily [Stylonychia lemnae]|uniref:Voltage-gated ion channel superfamily n=1 Tax=Stylonychia lemnae TaxID=5949 RepID=A0A078AWN1_STYLE|nr:voltage-gated ion channel superfamily [Stylonychia lemnae]|eukprot:CDW86569.1 voltage-gated ion channel superfamily [Stylonychia lemnae]